MADRNHQKPFIFGQNSHQRVRDSHWTYRGVRNILKRCHTINAPPHARNAGIGHEEGFLPFNRKYDYSKDVNLNEFDDCNFNFNQSEDFWKPSVHNRNQFNSRYNHETPQRCHTRNAPSHTRNVGIGHEESFLPFNRKYDNIHSKDVNLNEFDDRNFNFKQSEHFWKPSVHNSYQFNSRYNHETPQRCHTINAPPHARNVGIGHEEGFLPFNRKSDNICSKDVNLNEFDDCNFNFNQSEHFWKPSEHNSYQFNSRYNRETPRYNNSNYYFDTPPPIYNDIYNKKRKYSSEEKSDLENTKRTFQNFNTQSALFQFVQDQWNFQTRTNPNQDFTCRVKKFKTAPIRPPPCATGSTPEPEIPWLSIYDRRINVLENAIKNRHQRSTQESRAESLCHARNQLRNRLAVLKDARAETYEMYRGFESDFISGDYAATVDHIKKVIDAVENHYGVPK